jgi:hypothetical protein
MSSQKRRSRWEKRPTSGPLNLQERDLDILESVYRFRALSTRHIQLLHFSEKNYTGTQRRLDILFDYSLLERRFLPRKTGEGRSPTLHILDRAGADTLKQNRQLDVKWYYSYKDVSDQFLAHTYGISQVMAYATYHSRQLANLEIVEWLSEREVKADYDYTTITTKGKTKRQEKRAIVPDSYCLVKHNRLFRFFIELDRAQETTDTFTQKIQAYMEYHQSRAFEKRYGGRSLRVLTVIDSPFGNGSKRLAELKAAAEKIGAQNRYWFCQLTDLTHDGFWTAPIWQIASQVGNHPLFS